MPGIDGSVHVSQARVRVPWPRAAMLSVSFSAGEVPRVRRQHGFQLPLHPLQLSGWIALTLLSIGAFLLLIPALPPPAQPPILGVLSALLLLHLAAHLAAALVDPAEAALRALEPRPLPSLDRRKHAHVIEAGLCHLCGISTSSSRTKHCSACNKCVADFDHHCKWLNHCIGGRNYVLFLMCVATAVAAAALVAAIAIAELFIHQHWFFPEGDSKPQGVESNSTTPTPQSSLPSSDAAFLAIVAALGLLAAITAGLLLHLCFFHIYISFLGLTTYEYIRQQRQTQPTTSTSENPEPRTICPVRHRPVDFQCSNRTQTTLFTCTIFEESCGAEPTPTPPTTPQDCQVCVLNNSVAPELKPKKLRRRWNCCVSVPDSPEEAEPRCLISLCRHKKAKSNAHRTHGHWSSAKLRVLFRVLGNLGQHRRQVQSATSKNNQVVPVSNSNSELVQTVNNLVPVPCYPEVTRRANTLPSLPAPPRRRLISETELASALTILQQQQRCGGGRRQMYRRRRKSVVQRTKTPALSPIRESGLSNPASPSRQNCTVSAITSSCTRPF